MNDTINAGNRVAKPLPANTVELSNSRKGEKVKILHDEVESIHLKLFENQTYKDLLDAVYPEDAKEGSLIADDFELARMVRDYAVKANNHYVAKKKLDTIRKSLNVVLRRYDMDRKTRRDWKHEAVSEA